MSKQVEQIRAEVERRIKSWAAGVKYEGDAGDCQSRVTELTDLKKFIDSLPKEDGPKKPYFDKEYIESKIKAFSEAHKGETAEQIEAVCRGEEVPTEDTEADLEAEIQRAWREEKESGKYVDGSFDDFVCFQHIARHFAEWERKRTLDKVVEWMKANLTYTHPRKGVETCMVNIPAFLDTMNEENT